MTSAIWLNVAGIVLLVGLWVAAVVHGYRALGRDGRAGAATTAITSQPGLAARGVRPAQPTRPPVAAMDGRAALPGRA